jgi:acyl-homoserine-lactone acylase
MTPARAREMAFANRSLAADLLVPALLALCPEDPALAPACAALSGWDRRFEAESRGALLFHHAWPHIEAIKGLWATPFNLGDPVNTPRDPVASGPQGEALKAALRTALAEIAAAGLTPDARWGDVHFAPRAGSRIPIHGGDGVMGVLNVQRSVPAPGGHVPVHGTSYVQVVGFSDDGPVADALLSYSQSTNPASPWFADQTRLYATKNWVRLPFTPAEIEATRVGGVVRLEE